MQTSSGMSTETTTHRQSTPYQSPWSARERLGMMLWSLAWSALCQWTPKPLNFWRLMVLRVFGARISGQPFVHPRARIQIPWKLTLAHRACLGDRANAYTLGEISLGEGCTIAQEAYLCTGTHDFASPALPLQTTPISIGKDAFVGARALVLPGVKIGNCAVIGAGSVVTKDVADNSIVAGNPARVIGSRSA
jgi:putative colanic acid biosynthesis acetyltransferase WcaF